MFREKNQRNTNAVKTPKKHETPSTKRETVEDDKHKQHISKKEEGNPQMLDELQPQQQQPEEESHHGPPPDGLECLATMEDITLEDQNYVEYQTFPSREWHPAKYEESVIRKLLQEQFPTFVNKVKTTDCQAELRRLLDKGPPIYISDPHALALPYNGDTHIEMLWFSSDNVERSAKLDGALEGEERQKLWDELKEFIVVDGKEEGDDS